MELSSPEMNSKLPASEAAQEPELFRQPAAQRRAVSPAEKPGEPTARQCRTRRCGRCLRCLDEARWERIFAEKFADPTYYEEHLVKYSSPLA
jgi:hypothetical protein